MDHAAEAEKLLAGTECAGLARSDTQHAVVAIAHALLALNDTLKKIQEDTYTVAGAQ